MRRAPHSVSVFLERRSALAGPTPPRAACPLRRVHPRRSGALSGPRRRRRPGRARGGEGPTLSARCGWLSAFMPPLAEARGDRTRTCDPWSPDQYSFPSGRVEFNLECFRREMVGKIASPCKLDSDGIECTCLGDRTNRGRSLVPTRPGRLGRRPPAMSSFA